MGKQECREEWEMEGVKRGYLDKWGSAAAWHISILSTAAASGATSAVAPTIPLSPRLAHNTYTCTQESNMQSTGRQGAHQACYQRKHITSCDKTQTDRYSARTTQYIQRKLVLMRSTAEVQILGGPWSPQQHIPTCSKAATKPRVKTSN